MMIDFWGLLNFIGLGFCGGLLVGLYAESFLYRRILIGKSHPEWRTPEKIGAAFYYIVPESEYVEMLIARQRDDDSKRAAGP